MLTLWLASSRVRPALTGCSSEGERIVGSLSVKGPASYLPGNRIGYPLNVPEEPNLGRRRVSAATRAKLSIAMRGNTNASKGGGGAVRGYGRAGNVPARPKIRAIKDTRNNFQRDTDRMNLVLGQNGTVKLTGLQGKPVEKVDISNMLKQLKFATKGPANIEVNKKAIQGKRVQR